MVSSCYLGFLVAQQPQGSGAPCWVHTEGSSEPGKAWIIARDELQKSQISFLLYS